MQDVEEGRAVCDVPPTTVGAKGWSGGNGGCVPEAASPDGGSGPRWPRLRARASRDPGGGGSGVRMWTGGRGPIWLEAPRMGMTSVGRAIAARLQLTCTSKQWLSMSERTWARLARGSSTRMTLVRRAVAARSAPLGLNEALWRLARVLRAETLEDIGARGRVQDRAWRF